MSHKPVGHTQEPWSFDGEYIYAESVGGYVANPSTEDMQPYPLVIEANARRIVACVNACAGEPTGGLELISYSEQVDLKIKFFDECARLTSQRDELLDALKGLMLFTKPMKSNAVALNHCMRLIERIEQP